MLCFQAVKYLEGMIIAAQRQKERDKQKESDSTPSSTVPDNGATAEKPSSSTATPPPAPSTPTGSGETTKDKDKGTINIEPKTYCKLGHFHLLLENFSHGECVACFILFRSWIYMTGY